jgi:hypothetical protein
VNKLSKNGHRRNPRRRRRRSLNLNLNNPLVVQLVGYTEPA